jgi:hypothetical protein
MVESTLPAFERRASTRPAALFRELDGESVVLNLDTEQYFGLDEVGTRMWAVLTSSPSIETAYRTLLDEYDVAPDVLRRDLGVLVQRLADSGLIEVAGR